MLLTVEVLETARLFKGPLYDIFSLLFSRQRTRPSSIAGVWFNTCGYKDWMTFVQDFDLKNDLALSLQQIGEIFLAACHNDGEELLSRIGGHPDDIIRQRTYRKHLGKHGTGRDSFGNPLAALTLPTENSNGRKAAMSLFERSPDNAQEIEYISVTSSMLAAHRTVCF